MYVLENVGKKDLLSVITNHHRLAPFFPSAGIKCWPILWHWRVCALEQPFSPPMRFSCIDVDCLKCELYSFSYGLLGELDHHNIQVAHTRYIFKGYLFGSPTGYAFAQLGVCVCVWKAALPNVLKFFNLNLIFSVLPLASILGSCLLRARVREIRKSFHLSFLLLDNKLLFRIHWIIITSASTLNRMAERTPIRPLLLINYHSTSFADV